MCGWAGPPRKGAMRSKRVALIALLAVCGFMVKTAFAHAEYARSEPGAGAIVSTSPARVDIWFTQDLFKREGENWIRVTGPAGDEVQSGDTVVDDDDRRHISVALQADLPPGEYTIAYRTLSIDDGDNYEGNFSFTLDPQAQVTSTPMSAAPTPTDLPATPTPVAAAPTPTAAPAGGLGCGAALAPVVGLVGLVFGVRWKRRRT